MAYDAVLSVLAAAEAAVGLMLAGHRLSPAVSYPALALCRSLGGTTGKAVVGTVAACLMLLFATSVNDVLQIQDAASHAKESTTENSLYLSERLERAKVQALLTFMCAVFMPLLGALTHVITQHEKLKISHQAMLKQVKGLQEEYNRVTKEKGGDESSGAGDEEKLRERVAALRKSEMDLQDKLEASHKAQKAAEANASAMKMQAQALEREYDRLMAVKDEVEFKYERLLVGGGGGKKDS